MSLYKEYIVETLSHCKVVFDGVIEVLRNENTVCGHVGFESQTKYVLSLIELLTLETIKNPSKLIMRKLQIRRNEFANQFSQIMQKETHSMKACVECSKLMMCEILHIYSEIADFPYCESMNLSVFVTMIKFSWFGTCSLYTNIGRYFYSKTNIFRILYVNFLIVCVKLQTDLFNIDTHEIDHNLTQILSSFILFLAGFAANLYRLKTPQWIQLFEARDFFVELLNVMYEQCILMWNIYHITHNKGITTKLHLMNHVLFVILTFGLHHLQKQHITQAHKNNIKQCLTKFETINMGNDGYFASYIKSTILLFDDDKKKNYVMFYKKIRKYSNKCKKEMYKNSKCNNMKCSKVKAECKYCCSKCQVAIYCSKKCQKYDWNRGYHRSLCQKYCIDPQIFCSL